MMVSGTFCSLSQQSIEPPELAPMIGSLYVITELTNISTEQLSHNSEELKQRHSNVRNPIFFTFFMNSNGHHDHFVPLLLINIHSTCQVTVVLHDTYSFMDGCFWRNLYHALVMFHHLLTLDLSPKLKVFRMGW